MTVDTKEQILQAAEKLFSEHGFKSTSLRAITTLAGVNLAAVNYHFGSKDALVEAVFSRRLLPMNEERLRRLQLLSEQPLQESTGLEGLIRAFVGPALELSRDTEKGGAVFIRLLGRTYTEPSGELHDALRSMYEPVIDRFRPAFSEVLPELPDDELYWRLHFLVGLLAYLMAGSDMMRLIASCRMTEPHDTDLLIERLVVFAADGMRAPLQTT